MPTLKVSYILATHNRRDVLANTLARITNRGLNRADFEIIVVDNASTDGTLDVARAGADTVIDLRENHGSCAKAFGVDIARGQYIVFLDDDSYPRPGSIEHMIRHFEQQSSLAAAGFVVFLPNGQREGGALPDVFVGCGVGFRATALREVGGLDASFFMQAEEYDLAFRLVRAGWDVRMFGDLAVDHLKTPHARRTERTTYYDTRNNLRVISRYLPRLVRRICREDCIQRYQWLAERDNHQDSFARGVRDGLRTCLRSGVRVVTSPSPSWTEGAQRGSPTGRGEGLLAGICSAIVERLHYRRHRFDASTFEKLFRWNEIAAHMRSLKERGTRRILLADFGKNIYPFVDAARRAEIEIAAIADDRFAPTDSEGQSDRTYRGTPILPLNTALAKGNFDRIVISNTAPVHATRTASRLRELTDAPIDLWYRETIDHDLWPIDSTPARQMSDEILVERSASRAPCASRGTSVPGAPVTGWTTKELKTQVIQ